MRDSSSARVETTLVVVDAGRAAVETASFMRIATVPAILIFILVFVLLLSCRVQRLGAHSSVVPAVLWPTIRRHPTGDELILMALDVRAHFAILHPQAVASVLTAVRRCAALNGAHCLREVRELQGGGKCERGESDS